MHIAILALKTAMNRPTVKFLNPEIKALKGIFEGIENSRN
jgi:hypothetical protein